MRSTFKNKVEKLNRCLTYKDWIFRFVPSSLLLIISCLVSFFSSALASFNSFSVISNDANTYLKSPEDSLFCEIKDDNNNQNSFQDLGYPLTSLENKYYYTGSAIAYRTVFANSSISPVISSGASNFSLSLVESLGVPDVNYSLPYFGSYSIVASIDSIKDWSYLSQDSSVGALPKDFADTLLVKLGLKSYEDLFDLPFSIAISDSKNVLVKADVSIGVIFDKKQSAEGTYDSARHDSIFGKNYGIFSQSFLDKCRYTSLCVEILNYRNMNSRKTFFSLVASLTDKNNLSCDFSRSVNSSSASIKETQNSVSALKAKLPLWLVYLISSVLTVLFIASVQFIIYNPLLKLKENEFGESPLLVIELVVVVAFLATSFLVKKIAKFPFFGINIPSFGSNIYLACIMFLLWIVLTFVFYKLIIVRKENTNQ